MSTRALPIFLGITPGWYECHGVLKSTQCMEFNTGRPLADRSEISLQMVVEV